MCHRLRRILSSMLLLFICSIEHTPLRADTSTPPAIATITLTEQTQTDAGLVYTVIFDRPVSAVAPADFMLTGLCPDATVRVVAPTEHPTTYEVHISAAPTCTSVQLDYRPASSFQTSDDSADRPPTQQGSADPGRINDVRNYADDAVHDTAAIQSIAPRSDGVAVGLYVSMDMTSTDTPVLVYFDASYGLVKIAICDTLTCATPVIRNLAASVSVPSVRLTSTNLPRISYQAPTSRALTIMSCMTTTCSSWTTTTIDATRGSGVSSAIALTSSDVPVIVYDDDSVGALKLAICNNPTCSAPVFRTLDPSATGMHFASLALTATNVPVVSYYDPDTDDLKVAICNNPTCTALTYRTIDSAGDVGSQSSIAVNTSGYPVISYYDRTNNALKMARCTDATCATPVLFFHTRMGTSADAAVNGRSSIVIPSSNIPIISYYHTVSKDLMLSTCNNPVCVAPVQTTLDAAGDVGAFNAIALTSTSAVTVGYFDTTNERLKLSPSLRIVDNGRPSFFAKTAPPNAAVKNASSVLLSWNSVANADEYHYCISTVADGCFVAGATWSSTGVSTNVTKFGLTHNTTYYWHVRATNPAGSSFANNLTAWRFQVVIPPAAFVKSQPTNGATNRPVTPTLSWAGSTRATSYEYCYATSAVACTNWRPAGTARSVSLAGLSRNTTYFWNVRAKNAGGTTVSSTTPWRFTTSP